VAHQGHAFLLLGFKGELKSSELPLQVRMLVQQSLILLLLLIYLQEVLPSHPRELLGGILEFNSDRVTFLYNPLLLLQVLLLRAVYHLHVLELFLQQLHLSLIEFIASFCILDLRIHLSNDLLRLVQSL
jgi:hypothetical protein